MKFSDDVSGRWTIGLKSRLGHGKLKLTFASQRRWSFPAAKRPIFLALFMYFLFEKNLKSGHFFVCFWKIKQSLKTRNLDMYQLWFCIHVIIILKFTESLSLNLPYHEVSICRITFQFTKSLIFNLPIYRVSIYRITKFQLSDLLSFNLPSEFQFTESLSLNLPIHD